MSAEEIFAREAVLDLFKDFSEHVFFTCRGYDFRIPALSYAAKDVFHPEKLDSPGSFDRYL
jgi:hypothetical protein